MRVAGGRVRGGLLGTTGLICLLATRPAVADGCRRERVATAPLRDDAGFLSINASSRGRPIRLMLDTGSDAGLITPQAVRALGLASDPGLRIRLQGTGGGGGSASVVRLPGLAIGALVLGDVAIPVGALPGAPQLDPPVAGFLGGDVLSRFDLDIDVPDATLSLYRIGLPSYACAAPPAWPEPFATIALAAQGVRLSLPATLDGRPIRALLDTGARSHLLSRAAASRLGVSSEALAADPGGTTTGVDLREQPYHWHRFASLRIGDETTRSPVLTVAPLSEPFDMLLGSDWLTEREVWVSYATRQLFLRRPGR